MWHLYYGEVIVLAMAFFMCESVVSSRVKGVKKVGFA